MTAVFEPPIGSIGLVRISGAARWPIRFGQWLLGDGFEDYEHVVVYVGNGETVEAEPGGARLGRLDEYADIVWIECPAQYGEAVATHARLLLDTPYSFLDYDSLALHRVHLDSPWLRDYIMNTGHMICSQLVDEAARRGGWHLFDDGRWSGDVTPGDLWKLRERWLRGEVAWA